MSAIMEPVKQAMAQARQSWANVSNKELNVSIHAVVSQLAHEAWQASQEGDWNLAVKFMYYCHEIAKTHGHHEWYQAFLAVRRIRDLLIITKPAPKNLELPIVEVEDKVDIL